MLRLAFILALLAAPACVRAEEQSADSLSREVKEIFARCGKAVVKIHCTDRHSDLSGTGFFVDPAGTLYTSYSVGGDAENFTVEMEGRTYPARQILADLRSGLVMLKVDMPTPSLQVGKSESLEVATPVITIGYPLDLPETPSFGMIAGLDRKYLGRYFSTTHVRVNLPIQRGEAGAPLLNFKGEVIGIILASLENNSSCYALPIDAAEKIRSDYMRFGEARHGWIGLNVSESTKTVEGSRAEMTEILKDTPAAESGIKAGDILLQVGRTKVREPEDVLDASFYITAGDTVPITVQRGEEKLTFNVVSDFDPAGKNPPKIASPFSTNQAIPLNWQRTP